MGRAEERREGGMGRVEKRGGCGEERREGGGIEQ